MNNRIRSLSYGFSDLKNKPRCLPGDVINSSGKVSLSASESWCLFRLLPVILSDVVEVFEDIWELYLLLSEIMELVFAPRIERFMLSHLNSLIEKFYSLFASRAPEYITPKFHYLLHYPRLILQYGPLQNLWCMRFESFHRKLKKVAKQCPNFKNVALTVASRVQLGKCYEFSEGSCLSETETFGEKKIINPSCLRDDVINFLETELSFDPNQQIYSVSFVCANGVHYRSNLIFVIDVVDGLPVFACIENILVLYSRNVIVCKYAKPMVYVISLRMFEVELTDEIMFLQPGYELYANSLDLYKINGKKFVRPSNYFCESSKHYG